MRQIPQYPAGTLRVNPGGPAVRDRFYPRNIPDPAQRGIVTRYGLADNVELAALVSAAFADPNVIAFQTAHSISADDWAALAALITASIAPGASQIFPFEALMAAVDSPDVVAFAGVVGLAGTLAAVDAPDVAAFAVTVT